MRKVFFILSVLLLSSAGVMGQDQDKKAMTLRMGEFEWLDPVKPSEDKVAEIIEVVKAKVAETATASKRFEVLDEEITKNINTYFMSEAFMDLSEEQRKKEIMEAMNDNTLFGKITKCKFTKRTSGAQGYTCVLTVKLDVANAMNNAEILESRSFISNFKKMIVKNTPEAALDDALQSMTEKMTDFFANNFAVFGAIDKIKDGDAIITCGQQQGVKEGDEFQVTLATFDKGAITEKPVGIIKVKSLMADGTSICGIKDGKDAIVENNVNKSQNQWLRCKLILK
ncbi:hypothetical protein [Bacteroides sp.]